MRIYEQGRSYVHLCSDALGIPSRSRTITRCPRCGRMVEAVIPPFGTELYWRPMNWLRAEIWRKRLMGAADV